MPRIPFLRCHYLPPRRPGSLRGQRRRREPPVAFKVPLSSAITRLAHHPSRAYPARASPGPRIPGPRITHLAHTRPAHHPAPHTRPAHTRPAHHPARASPIPRITRPAHHPSRAYPARASPIPRIPGPRITRPVLHPASPSPIPRIPGPCFTRPASAKDRASAPASAVVKGQGLCAHSVATECRAFLSSGATTCRRGARDLFEASGDNVNLLLPGFESPVPPYC